MQHLHANLLKLAYLASHHSDRYHCSLRTQALVFFERSDVRSEQVVLLLQSLVLFLQRQSCKPS